MVKTEESEKPGNISAGADAGQKDDCSDLTDNNNDGEEQTPKSFPQKVSVFSFSVCVCEKRSFFGIIQRQVCDSLMTVFMVSQKTQRNLRRISTRLYDFGSSFIFWLSR